MLFGRPAALLFSRQAASLFCLASFSFLLIACASPALALDEATTLNRAEKLLFGHAFAHEDTGTRLNKIEKRVFGRKKGGDTEERLERITHVLLLEKQPVSGTGHSAAAPAGHASGTGHSAAAPAGQADSQSSVNDILKEGMAADSQGKFDQAEQAFRKALLADPRNPDAYFNLGALSERKGDLVAALVSYRAALNLDPGDRELQEAVTSIERMMGLSPTPVAAPDFNRNEQHPQPKVALNEPMSADVFEPRFPQLPVPDNDAFVPTIPVSHQTHQTHLTQQTHQPGQPFQLQTSKSQAAASANQNQSNGQTRKRKGSATKAVLGVALSVGASYALRASGLHCPMCRIGGGAGIMRGVLRGF